MTRCIPDSDTIPLPKGLAALTSKGYNLAPTHPSQSRRWNHCCALGPSNR